MNNNLGKNRFWTQSHSGKPFDLFDPKPEQIDIHDIAIALSRIARYNGHTKEFYSVAEHCVIGSKLYPNITAKERLDILLHDAAEAYIGDIVDPLKKNFPWIKHIESNILGVIYEALELERPEDKSLIKQTDLIMVHLEKSSLMAPEQRDWRLPSRPEAEIEFKGFYNWSPNQALIEFLLRYDSLRKDMDMITHVEALHDKFMESEERGFTPPHPIYPRF